MFATQNRLRFKPLCLALAAAAVVIAFPANAEMIELTNGDHYLGKVVSMDSNTIEFISEIQGKIHIPRAKVAQVTFHEVIARPALRTNAPAAVAPIIMSGPSTPATIRPVIVATNGGASAEDVVAQMRKEGIQPQLMNQVQEQIFGKASPEASQKFDEIMSGLMSGQVSVADLRVQAQNAIQQARDAKKDLGGDAGEMLDGYIGILEKFVAESAPGAATSTPAPSTTK
jgi:hypothetical protein